jgi:tetratricopeptide (TPR) repeat protein
VRWLRHLRAFWANLRGDHEAASGEYRTIVESDPNDPAAFPLVVNDYRKRGKAAEVVALSQRALKQEPSNFIALDALVWAYVSQGDHHRARPTLEQASRALAGLKLEDLSTSPGLRVSLAATRALSQLPGLRQRLRVVPTLEQFSSETDRYVSEWNAWAAAYFAWYAQEYGPQPTGSQ